MNEISVIVPVYNVEKYISNFIKSIINQTFQDFELILVNDGSTDNSIEIAKQELVNTNINYKIINKENGGQSSARNTGIKNAIGNWIVFPDSDDALQKDYLKLMFEQTKKEEVEVIICDINNVTDENIFEETKRNNNLDKKTGKDFFVDFFMHRISIGPVSLAIKKEVLQKNEILFNENSRYSEEFTFISDVLYSAKQVVHIKEKLYNYCLRGGSVSTGANIEKILNGYNEIIKNAKKYYIADNQYCKIYRKFAMPRWILATARFTAANLNYDDYKELMKKLNAKKEIKKLIFFPDIKTKIASIIFIISMKLFYIISK